MDHYNILSLIILITEAGQMQDERMRKIENDILVINNRLKILVRGLR